MAGHASTLGIFAASIGIATMAVAQDMPAVPSFIEEGQPAGISSIYAGDWKYMVGGGVATFDCSGDGKADILLAGGEAPATFYRNTSAIGAALTFAPAVSGLELDAVTGTYPVDVDSDGKVVSCSSPAAIDFRSILEMRSGEQLPTPFRIVVRGLKPGPHRIRRQPHPHRRPPRHPPLHVSRASPRQADPHRPPQ